MEEDPCTGLCVDVLHPEPRSPYVVGFDLRLRDGAGSIKSGVEPKHFTILENDQPLDLSETNQFIRSGDGLPLKVMVILDYSNSVSEAGAISALIAAAEAFVEPSPFSAQDDLAVINIRHSARENADILVGPFQPANCQTREAIVEGRFNSGAQPCAMGGVWDAVTLAIRKLDSEQESRNRVVMFITDGRDPFPDQVVQVCASGGADAGNSVALAGPDGLIQLASEAGVRLVPVGFGNLFGTGGTLAELADSTGGLFVAAEAAEGPGGIGEALAEAGLFLRGLPGPLNVVMVLDYTIASASQTDITGLISAVRSFVQPDHFNATQQIGIVEFHDRTGEGEGYSEVIGLTAADCEGRAKILEAIPREGELEHGQTRLWDAVNLALARLLAGETGGDARTSARLAAVFLTDGYDTTSTTTASALLSLASENNVALYPIDFGQVTAGQTAFGSLLQALAAGTGGQYFRAERATDLAAVFKDIAEELLGQWNLTYITQKNAGSVNVRVEFSWQGQRDAFQYGFDAGAIQGRIHEGILQVYDPQYDVQADRTTFRLRALYVPRNVNKFRFLLPADSQLHLQSNGGLTPPAGGWEVCRRGAGQCIDVVRLRTNRHDDADGRLDRSELPFPGLPLQFGTFGNIGTISVPGLQQTLLIRHDDDIYLDLAQPKTMVIQGAVEIPEERPSCSGACEHDPAEEPEPATQDPDVGQIAPQDRPREADGGHRNRPGRRGR
jgi:hypothetical protein